MYQDFLEIGDSVIPIKVHFHRKPKLKGKLTSDHAILHLPQNTTAAQKANHIEKFKAFLVESLTQKKELLKTFELKPYKDGDQITVRSTTYHLAITPTSKKNHTARLKGQTVFLITDQNQHPYLIYQAIRRLLSRVFAKVYIPIVKERVYHLNNQHFGVSINEVKLKYNRSNWGSCSSKGNINLSTRLLMAPEIVMDYVIIHELAHRIEPNHSPQFWKVVRQAMPNYLDQEQWLKKYGNSCDFNTTN